MAEKSVPDEQWENDGFRSFTADEQGRRGNIKAMASALGRLRSLQCDLKQCHDHLEAAAAQGGEQRATALDAIERALWRRYAGMVDNPCRVPMSLLLRAFRRAVIEGTWRAAVDVLVREARVVQPNPPSDSGPCVPATVCYGSDCWSEARSSELKDPVDAILLQFRIPYGLNREFAKAQLRATINRVFDDRIAPLLRPTPGKRSRGGNRGAANYTKQSQVAALWKWWLKQKPNSTPAQLAYAIGFEPENTPLSQKAAKIWPGDPPSRQAIEKAIENDIKAVQWLMPRCPLQLPCECMFSGDEQETNPR